MTYAPVTLVPARSDAATRRSPLAVLSNHIRDASAGASEGPRLEADAHDACRLGNGVSAIRSRFRFSP